MGFNGAKRMSNQFRKILYGSRLANGSLVKGRWVEGAAAPLSFIASVQPTTPHDVKFLEIGRRETKSYTLYTDTRLIALTAGVRNPDRVYIDGETYEVDVEAPWQNNVISHYKFIVTLMQAIES
jgi:hypothetical protein